MHLNVRKSRVSKSYYKYKTVSLLILDLILPLGNIFSLGHHSRVLKSYYKSKTVSLLRLDFVLPLGNLFSLGHHLRDSVTRFFASGFFRESSSFQPLIRALGSFRTFFLKFAEIFASQGAPPVSTTPAANLQRHRLLKGV